MVCSGAGRVCVAVAFMDLSSASIEESWLFTDFSCSPVSVMILLATSLVVALELTPSMILSISLSDKIAL